MLRSGKYWLGWLEEHGQLESLLNVIRYGVEHKFGALPDVEDHVAAAFAAVVEGADRFSPTYTRADGTEAVADGLHNFIRYVIGLAMGEARASARRGGNWSDEAVTFSDMTPDWDESWELMERLGVSHMYQSADQSEAEEAIWVVNNGKAFTTTELIAELAEKHGEVAARIAGCSVEELPMVVLRALDTVESGQEPWFTAAVEARTPVVNHDLDDTVVVRRRNGKVVAKLVVSGAQLKLQVEEASAQGALWVPEDEPRPSQNWLETDRRVMPWEDERRRVNESWPETVTHRLFDSAVANWQIGEETDNPEYKRLALRKLAEALNVGVNWELLGFDPIREDWENHREYTEVQIRRVLRAFATMTSARYNTLVAAFGVERDGPGIPGFMRISREPVARWIATAMKGDRGGKLRAGVEALVLHGATVQAARA